MKLDEIRQLAQELNIPGAKKLRKAELIRAVQSAEGNNPCFGAPWRAGCGELDCSWRPDCLSSRD